MGILLGPLQNIFQERVVYCRKTERDRLRQEREETISNIIQYRKAEREAKRKIKYFLKSEEEPQRRLREEEAAWKLEEMERQKKEETERKEKLNEIAQKQRQREIEPEEKERQRREEILGRSAAPAVDPPPPAPRKFIPRFRRVAAEGGGQVAAPPPASTAPAAGARAWQSTRDQELDDVSLLKHDFSVAF